MALTITGGNKMLEQKDLANNKKVLKMFHRFEEDIVGQQFYFNNYFLMNY